MLKYVLRSEPAHECSQNLIVVATKQISMFKSNYRAFSLILSQTNLIELKFSTLEVDNQNKPTVIQMPNTFVKQFYSYGITHMLS